MDTVINASGRPNSSIEQLRSFTDKSWDSSGRVTVGSTHTYVVVKKSFAHQSVSSPRISGKLRIRSNPYNMTKIEESRGVVKVEGSSSMYGGFVSYVYFSTGGGYLPYDISHLETQAVSRSRENFLKEVQNASANILLALAERREILETVMALTKDAYKKLREYKKLIDRFNRLTSDVARKRFLERYLTGFSGRGLSKSKDKAADLWLFYAYAIMPLILEIKQLIGHIKEIEPRAVHGRARRSFSGSHVITDSYYRGERRHVGYVSSHVRGYVTIVDPYKKLLSEFGFTNIATIIWERITYSFVVDWFINIGSWLASLTALDGVIVTDYNETITTKNGMSVSDFQSTNGGGWLIQSSLENPDFFMYKHKKRSVPDQPPKPQIFTDVNLNWRRLISGVALINQQLFRLK